MYHIRDDSEFIKYEKVQSYVQSLLRRDDEQCPRKSMTMIVAQPTEILPVRCRIRILAREVREWRAAWQLLEEPEYIWLLVVGFLPIELGVPEYESLKPVSLDELLKLRSFETAVHYI